MSGTEIWVRDRMYRCFVEHNPNALWRPWRAVVECRWVGWNTRYVRRFYSQARAERYVAKWYRHNMWKAVR